MVITREENKKPLEIKGRYGDIWNVLQTQLDFK
jgi:hypothetical protein